MINNGLTNAKVNDEVYTPRYAVLPIMEFLDSKQKIVLPFDTKESEFYKVLKEYGFDVTAQHRDDGQDFFMDFYNAYDIIISNPPYSIKDQVLERLYLIGKPFMMLLPVTTLSSQFRFKLFKRESVELLVFDKRIDYKGHKGNFFASAYFCWNVLPEKLVFREIQKEK